MTFPENFTPLDQIQLLQRSILVNSFAYYELNSNVLTDHQYDANARQLVSLIRAYPDEAKKSRYRSYFQDFCPAGDDAHYVSGFDLLQKVNKKDPELYRHIWIDALMALENKSRNLQSVL